MFLCVSVFVFTKWSSVDSLWLCSIALELFYYRPTIIANVCTVCHVGVKSSLLFGHLKLVPLYLCNLEFFSPEFIGVKIDLAASCIKVLISFMTFNQITWVLMHDWHDTEIRLNRTILKQYRYHPCLMLCILHICLL